MSKFFVTGAAGFIGSNFIDSALAMGHIVQGYDDLSTGNLRFLNSALKGTNFSLSIGNILDQELLRSKIENFNPDWVIHFAANADVKRGLVQRKKDLEINTVGTWNVAEASSISGCKNILFSSTGSVYGEPNIFPTPETAPFPTQTSLYAASKLAGESILSAYALGFNLNCVNFRFVSILGPRYSHGHVIDFIKMLLDNPHEIKVLGNGLQQKSYLHVNDLIDGLWLAINSQLKGFQTFNIGHNDTLTVNQSLQIITEELNLKPIISYTGGERGWIGDSPKIQLDTSRLQKLGWSPKISLKDAIKDSVNYLLTNKFLLEKNK